MADETPTTNPEQQNPATPPAGAQNTETPQAEQSVPYARFQEVTKRLRDLEATQAKADKAREEAERKRLVEDAKWQELYESERKARADSEAQIAALAEERKQDKVRESVRQAAHTAGFVDPADALGFLDAAALVVDEAGNVSNARQMVEKLAKDKPYLLGTGKPTPGVTAGPRPARVTPLTPADVRRMSRDEIAANYDAAIAAMKQ